MARLPSVLTSRVPRSASLLLVALAVLGAGPLATAEEATPARILVSIAQSSDGAPSVVIGEVDLPEGSTTDTRWDGRTDRLEEGTVVRAGRSARALMPAPVTEGRVHFELAGMPCVLVLDGVEGALEGCPAEVVVANEALPAEDESGVRYLVTVNIPGARR